MAKKEPRLLDESSNFEFALDTLVLPCTLVSKRLLGKKLVTAPP